MPVKGKQVVISYFAEDVVNGGGKAADAANHTLRVLADGVEGTVAASPSQADATNLPGVYKVSVAAGENSGEMMLLGGISSTGGVVVRPVQWTNVVNLTAVNGVTPSTSDGTATAGGAATITLQAGTTYGANALRDRTITVVAGTGMGQSEVIASNTAATPTVVTISRNWLVPPDATSQYAIDPSGAAPSVAGQTPPANWSTDVVQTGDSFARIGTNGAGLTALGDARLGNLDAAVSTRSTYAGGAVASVTDRTGFSLASTGLDAISATAPTGVASNFREMMVQTWRRFFKASAKNASSLTIRTYADNGTTVLTTQSYTDDGAGNETLGASS